MGSVAAPYTAPKDMLGSRCTGRIMLGDRDDVVAVVHFTDAMAHRAFKKSAMEGGDDDRFFETLVDQCVECVAIQTGRRLDHLPRFFASEESRRVVASSTRDPNTGELPCFGVLVSTGRTFVARSEQEAARLARQSSFWSSPATPSAPTMEYHLDRARMVLSRAASA